MIVHITPTGKVGKEFVLELSRLFRAYGETSALEAVSLNAAMILSLLLLQKPSPKAKVKDHISCLQRRLLLWHKGDIAELLREGGVIQQRLSSLSRPKQDSITKSFGKLMRKGRVKAAMRLLSSSDMSVMSIHDKVNPTNGSDRTVLDYLKSKLKHPPGSEVNPDAILSDQELDFQPVIFESIDAESIRAAAL